MTFPLENRLPYALMALLVLAVFYAIYFSKVLAQKRQGIQTHQIGRRKEKSVHTVELLMSAATLGAPVVQLLSIIFDWSCLPANARFTGFCIGMLGDAVFLVAVLTMLTGGLAALDGANPVLVVGAIALVCTGVIGLGVVEAREDDELRARRQEQANRKYSRSWLAICLPIAYCLLDAAGTFADSRVLETLNEDSANVAYELTFLFAGLCCLAYLLIRRKKFVFKLELPKYIGAACETIGQLFYIYALADEEHVMMSAPIISAYCVLSAVWGRIFLKEKLSWKHYLMIALVVAGIVILGVYDI